MKNQQPAILLPLPAVGRYLLFSLAQPGVVREALSRLAPLGDGDAVLVAIGPQLVAALGASVPGLREFPAMSGHGVEVPSTPTALLCWLRGSDLGNLVLKTRELEQALTPALHLERVIDAFCHRRGANGLGRDLTGYEDGTENPHGEAAEVAALVHGQGPGLDGASFMAAQQWLHDFDAFDAMNSTAQDDVFGRRRSDNEELEGAPESAHVKRTAQESFTPEAFVIRRSMPWAQGPEAGFMFIAFGQSLDAFEAQMRRMAGQEDGVTDALFRISRPVSGAYFWCPPLHDGRLDLRQLGL